MALPPFGKDHAARIVALEQTVKEQARVIAELAALVKAQAEKKTRQKTEASNA